MRFVRYSFACLSSTGWAASLFVVAAAVAFTPMEVFAETSVPEVPQCTDPEVRACEDAGEGTACFAGGSEGKCDFSYCKSGGTTVSALSCERPQACPRDTVTACEGLAVGAPCTLPHESAAHKCFESSCDEKSDAGVFERWPRLVCGRDYGSSNGTGNGNGSPPPSAPSPETPSDTTSSQSGSSSDSGCSMTASPAGVSTFLAATPLGLIGLLAARRRRARR